MDARNDTEVESKGLVTHEIQAQTYPRLWIKKLHVVKMSILSKLINGVNIIQIEAKIYRDMQRTREPKILKKKKKVGDLYYLTSRAAIKL